MILNNGNIEVCLRFFIAHMHSTVDLFSASVKYSFLFSWTLCHAFPFMRSLSPRVQRSTGGGVLPSKRLLGMCRWMGSHFHNWIDYIGVTFLVELLEWGRTFSGFLG